MQKTSALDRIAELLRADQSQTVNTSMRIPVALRDAASIATDELKMAQSTTVMTVEAIRHQLRSLLMRASLDEHYDNHPGSRPTLAELAQAEADLSNHRLKNQSDLITRAAQDITKVMQHPSPSDVLIWADSLGFYQPQP